MATGLNGQPVIREDSPLLVTIEVPGGVKLRVHREFAPVAAYVARRWHVEVEPLKNGQCWGYDYRPARAGGGRWSSHSTGYAIDLNSNGAGSMLWGDDQLKATKAQLAAMAKIKKDTGLLWGGPESAGGDYSQPRYWDPMHWDVPAGVDGPRWCRALIRRLGIQPDGTTGTPAPVLPGPKPQPMPQPQVPVGKGPEWLLAFLRAMKCPPAMERAWWTNGIREIGGDPACLYPAGAPWGDWTHGNGRHFDTGWLQVNDRHLDAVRKMFGPMATMQSMLDPVRCWQYAQTLKWSDWGLVIAADGASYTFNWAGWPADWIAKNAAAAEAGFKQAWDAYPKYAGTKPTPPPAPKPKPKPRPVVKLADVQPGKVNASVELVQRALAKTVGLDYSTGPGTFGPRTTRAYAEWQRQCGYSGSDADGSPGRDSLTRLGSKTRLFTVAA